MNNCGLETKSCEIMAKAISKNPELKLEEIQASNNKFGKKGFVYLKKFI